MNLHDDVIDRAVTDKFDASHDSERLVVETGPDEDLVAVTTEIERYRDPVE